MSAQPAPRSFTVLSSLKWPAIVDRASSPSGERSSAISSPACPGLVSGLLGAAMWLVFLALTAISIQVAIRATKDDPGLAACSSRSCSARGCSSSCCSSCSRSGSASQPWLDPTVFFVTVIIAVVGSLVFDVIAFQRARVPYVGDVELPQTVEDDAPDEDR